MEVRTVLKYLILTTQELALIFIFIGAILSFIDKSKIKKSKLMLAISILLGLAIAFTQFIFKILHPKRLNIYLYKLNGKIAIVTSVILIIALIVVILHYFVKNNKLIYIEYIILLLSLVGMISYVGPAVFRYTTEFVQFGEKTITTMSMLRFSGFLFGIIINLLMMLAIIYSFKNLSSRMKNIIFFITIVVINILYFATAISFLGKLRVIKGSVFKFSLFSSTFKIYSIYILLAMIVFIAAYIVINNGKAKGVFANNALLRKEKAKLRNRRRWSYFMTFVSVLIVLTLTVVKAYDNKEEVPVPPEEVQETDTEVIIPLKQVEDGHLHRFVIKGKNVKEIKFLAVRKPGGASYGLGLDACEICGLAGYIERKDQIVCKRCDVVMNKATIGFKGGCNPIPFEYKVENGKIVIKKEALYAKEKVFR